MSAPIIGVDLGGTNARAARVDVATGRILAEEKIAVTEHHPEALVALVDELVRRVAGGAPEAVGIGFAGMLRGWSGVVVNAPNFGWREVNLREMLRARLGTNVELYNDLDAIAYGEQQYGAARGARDVLCVFVGTGVGGGLIVDGKVAIGATHLGGEIGHSKVIPNGRLCGCGQRGCVEAYTSGKNIAERARTELAHDRPGGGERSLAVKLAGSVDGVHAGHLDEAARSGDPYAVRLWAEIAPLLGVVLANAVTLLNPSRVVMGGGVWEGAPLFRQQVLASYRELVNAPSGEAAEIVDTSLGDGSGVLGAAALVGHGVIHP